ncbi:PilZ domain-containing protein [Sphingomonas tabacisoli]|uniref:PilZ domain-containing protein n=1 Tax=Sphingomonas tabacisoli TaxID=2249466 RepID=A0ABW4I089_9SPHN
MQQQTGNGQINAPRGIERRRTERFNFIGGEVYLFAKWRDLNESQPNERHLLRLRDLSVSGISGLTDAPVAVGDTLFVQLDETLIPAAQVVWFRRVLVGFSFVEWLPQSRLSILRERHEAGHLWSPAMRLRSDLPNWWTDVGEHERGRQGIISRN